MFWRTAIAAAVMAALPAMAQDLPALYRVSGVAAGDVLNIRAAPMASGAPLGALPPDTTIEVVALAADGRWARINHAEGTGWVAMRHLDRQTRGNWIDAQTPVHCRGTEPFWRMDLFLPGHQVEFHALTDGFGAGGVELVAQTAPLPATAHPPTLAIPLSGARDGVAVLRGAQCSDGMSDRTYGLEVQVYWRDSAAGLSGCCTLSP